LFCAELNGMSFHLLYVIVPLYFSRLFVFCQASWSAIGAAVQQA